MINDVDDEFRLNMKTGKDKCEKLVNLISEIMDSDNISVRESFLLIDEYLINNPLNGAALYHFITDYDDSGASIRALENVRKKLGKDPKQVEKLFVLDCWKKWQQFPLTYTSKTAFANDMLDKCEHLESQKVITDWCREWEKEHPAS